MRNSSEVGKFTRKTYQRQENPLYREVQALKGYFYFLAIVRADIKFIIGYYIRIDYREMFFNHYYFLKSLVEENYGSYQIRT